MTTARRRILRWGLRLGVIVTLVALWSVDARMKGGERAGFVPANAEWVAYTPSFGHAWSGTMRTQAFRDFHKQWPQPYSSACVSVRLATGVRPTPTRWGTWLGKKAVLYGSARGVGWSVRPGLLVRMAHWVNASVSTPAAPDIFRYGPYCYSWREGFLLFSTSPEVVKDALAGTEFRCSEPVKRGEVYVAWQGEPRVHVVVAAREGFPARGVAQIPLQEGAPGVTRWPGEPFLEVNSTGYAAVSLASNMLQLCFKAFPQWTNLGNFVPDANRWGDVATKAAPVAECGLALFASTTQDSKSAKAALRFRFQKELPSGVEPFAAAGEDRLVAAGAGRVRYLASDDGLAGILAANAEEGTASPEPFMGHVDWERAGRALEGHFRSILEQDDTLRDPIEGEGIPAVQAMATLGQLHIEGRIENGHLAFTGELAAKTPSPQE